jgi:peptide/nickel transport system substrate-binding protein
MTRGGDISRSVLTLLVAAGAVAPSPAAADEASNSLRMASHQVLESAHPYFTNQSVAQILADHVWDTLVYQDPRTGAYEGNLATAWRQIDDRTLEFDLREGVRFHNGEPFDADDVVYSVAFLADSANKAVYLSLIRWLDHAEKVDSHTVRIVSRDPFPAALAYLSNPLLSIQPNEYHERVGPKGVEAGPIGTGPYRVTAYARGKYIRLVRNEDFHDGPKRQPTIDEVEIRFIPDAQTRVAEVVSGGVDFIMQVARDQAEQLRGRAGLAVAEGDSTFFHFLQLNTRADSPAPQLHDIRVRRAILHAIDRDTLARFVVGERSRVIHAPCHPSQFGCIDAGATRYDYDPGKSRALLAEAGFPEGLALDLFSFNDRNQTQALVGYLAAVGIRARLRSLQSAAVRTAVRSNRAALAHWSLGTLIRDVSNSTSQFFELSTDDLNRDGDVSDLLRRGDTAMNPAERERAYAQAIGLLTERALVLPLYTEPFYYVTDDDLMFTPTPDGRPHFYEMDWR